MKNEKKKHNNRIMRNLIAIGAVVGVIGIGTIMISQARRNVLESVDEYAQKDEFKILEIVPTNDADANEEIGYFVSEANVSEENRADFLNVSKAKSLGGLYDTSADTDLSEVELQNFLDMRNYGLIKYEGIDRGTYNIDASEYPVYSQNASFVKHGANNADYVALANQFVLGNYQLNNANNGSYFLKDGYTILEDGFIYREETIVDDSVSGNSVSDNTVSENTIYIPVGTADANNKSLPEGIEQRFDENGNLLSSGNVDFVANERGAYYGLSVDAYYYRIPSTTNPYYNGDWFKEYVLGDRTLNSNVTIDTIAANQISKDTLSDNAGNAKYDLIYISGSYDAYVSSNVDLTDEVVMHLFNITSKDDYQAVIMDFALLGPTSSSNPTNIEKLALLLWQQDQSSVLNMSTEGLDEDAVFNVDEDGNITSLPVSTANIWSTLGASMQDVPGMSTGNFVAGSVYVYQHMRSYFNGSKVQVDAKDFFANGDFASTYTDGVIASGFAYVKSAIQMHNVNHTDKKVAEAITPAVVIQYILSHDGTIPTLIKADYRVLEIQPVKAFKYNTYWGTTAYIDCAEDIQENRKEFIGLYFDESFKENPGLVSFTSMTIEEFIGRNEDLNETYDMIYIGSNISHTLGDDTYTYYYMNNRGYTKIESEDDSRVLVSGRGQITDFNDNHMDGMVYYNIGDIYYIGTNTDSPIDSLLGILEGETYGSTTERGTTRFSGRDLTEDKKNKLIDYLNTGYPVVVAGDMMRTVYDETTDTYEKVINPTTYNSQLVNLDRHGWDHGRVDNSSKLYEFLDYGVNGTLITDDEGDSSYEGGDVPNLISEADVKAGFISATDISGFLNKPKLTLNLTSKPVEYSYSTRNVNTQYGNEPVIDEQSKLSPDPVTGKYYLDYEFTISNAATILGGGDTYGVHLYIDVNADGKFSESEELADCTVTNAVTGAEVSFSTGIQGRTYSLNTDVLYKLRREVPEGFSGILPWSLEIAMDSNSSIRASENGYSQVPRLEQDKININILQINKNTYDTLNLEQQLADPTGYSIAKSQWWSEGYNWSPEYYYRELNNYFGLYLSELEDYNVNIKTVSQEEYETAYRADNTYLDGYDMLILGFGDAYDAFDDDGVTVQGLINFMETGRPVLLTHDLVMFRAGVSQTRMLRNIVGMDRYGVYSDLTINGVEVLRQRVKYTRAADSEIMNAIEEAGRRVVYTPGEAKQSTDYQTQGISNLNIVRWRYDANSPDKRYINTERINNFNKIDWGDQKQYTVHNINEGQITTYPYVLPDSFDVAETHGQWYQLDMESDMDQDGETDVVVWYTLGNRTGQDETFTGEGSEYNYNPNDVINNYYIYNRGNITYSGVGHRGPAATSSDKYEAQLFVNTMIAAYRAGVRSPSVRIYETAQEDSSEIDSLAVAYDKNIGKDSANGDAQSSVLRYEDGTFKHEFVDEGDTATKVYFQVNDPNFVKGDKNITVNFYLEDPNGEHTINISEEESIKVTKVPLQVYSSDFSEIIDATDLKSGVRYGINLPLSYLSTRSEFKLYVEAQTFIKNISVTNKITETESPVAVEEFSVVKMDLLNLD